MKTKSTKLYILVAGLFLAIVGTGLSQSCIDITSQPTNQTPCYGTEVTFTVGATGTEPLAYQWQQSFDGVTFADRLDATNNTLVITNVQGTDTANYRVIITNVDCMVTSMMAFLFTISTPSISSQPTNWPSVSLGANLANRVVAGGMLLTYQWRLNGVPLPGVTKSTIILTNLQASQVGSYDVVVANPCGSTNSRVVTLEVDPTFTKITSGPVVQDKLTGSGLLWGDYDNDNNVDLLVLNDPQTGVRSTNILYRNQGDGTFVRVIGTSFGSIQGTYNGGVWTDLNDDGWLDFYVPDSIRWYSAGATPNHLLYFGGPGGNFTRVTGTPTGSAVPMAWDATVGDFDNDGLLDLFVAGAWVDRGTRNHLFRNTGDGAFTRVTQGPIPTDSANSELLAACDYDGDGDLDLLVSSHSQRLLYQNDGTWSFTRINTGPIVTDPGNSAGLAWGDYDNDGRMDLCLATYDQTLRLFHNEGQGVFQRTLLGPPSNYQIPIWGDYDNDGWLDLFVTHAYLQGEMRNRLYHNNGDGTFTDIKTGSPSNEGGYSGACAWADYDNNGFLDLVVGNSYRPVTNNFLYRNNGNSNHWLVIKLVGTASNRAAIGAKVRATATVFGTPMTQMREIPGAGNRSQGDGRAHFGLGDATNVTTLRIEWPSGIVQTLTNVATNQFLTIVESQDYDGAAPQFNGVTNSPGGLQLSFIEPAADARYVLEASTNLVNWTKLMARTSLGTTAQFTDTRTTNYTRRFYRLQVP